MTDSSPLEQVTSLLRESQGSRLEELLAQLSPSEMSHVVSRLEEDERARLIELLSPASAALLLQSMPLALTSEVLDDVEPDTAATVVNRLPSDVQADVLSSIDQDKAAAVLARMAPDEVADVNRLSRFASHTAGGLMATEFLAYPASTTVGEVVTDLRRRADEYAQYPVQYVYVVSGGGRLHGVVRLRDLLFHADAQPLSELALREPVSVSADAGLAELRDFFERTRFFAAPVLDSDHRMLGVVTRADFDEASADQAAQTLLRFSGIVFGEEFRSMPLWDRVGGRLAWLAMTMLLSFVAASVVGLFQDTLADVIALAVFLPVISGMSGNAGNQAIAVTLRELSLGLVRPQETSWVLAKEAGMGAINGLTLGLAMTLAAFAWKGDPYLGMVVGGAQAMSVLVAACLGGIIPMLLKRLGFDPALASAPLLTTITDATGFFLTLGLASVWLAS
jgi:magnesium transporter